MRLLGGFDAAKFYQASAFSLSLSLSLSLSFSLSSGMHPRVLGKKRFSSDSPPMLFPQERKVMPSDGVTYAARVSHAL